MGFDSSTKILEKGYGGTLALPVWVDIMLAAQKEGYPANAIRTRPGSEGQAVLVCRESNQLAHSGCQYAKTAYFETSAGYQAPANMCERHIPMAEPGSEESIPMRNRWTAATITSPGRTRGRNGRHPLRHPHLIAYFFLMISPFFPWFLAFLLLIACVALLVLLLRYRDRSVRLEAESRSWQERAEDRTQMLRRAEEVLKDSFAGISAEVLRNSEKQFLNLAETRLQSQRQQANHDLDSRKQAIESMLKPVSESLKLVQSRLGEMEKERVGAYTDLKTQIRYILSGNEALKNETARLSQALHHNSVRGQWGELQLRRVVELAGMVEYCDFTTQETRSREEERVRPDMVIHLPGGRSIIIDAKAPMASYLNAGQTENPEERSQWMARHAADVKRHLQQLSAKNYFAQFSPCPEFVIMFLPGESFSRRLWKQTLPD